jgi:hypothetical protein
MQEEKECGLFGTKFTPLHRRPAGGEKKERRGRTKRARF